MGLVRKALHDVARGGRAAGLVRVDIRRARHRASKQGQGSRGELWSQDGGTFVDAVACCWPLPDPDHQVLSASAGVLVLAGLPVRARGQFFFPSGSSALVGLPGSDPGAG
jgi:hypothetical protein